MPTPELILQHILFGSHQTDTLRGCTREVTAMDSDVIVVVEIPTLLVLTQRTEILKISRFIRDDRLA